MSAFAAPTLTPGAAATLAGVNAKLTGGKAAKARAVAEEFEAMFLNSMFQQMFASVGNGPFGGGPGATVWRSFLTDEYAKSFVKKGGIGKVLFGQGYRHTGDLPRQTLWYFDRSRSGDNSRVAMAFSRSVAICSSVAIGAS